MAKDAKGDRPWYGKTCVRCEAPINYAYAKKGELPGYCGKCADETRRQILVEARAAEPAAAPARASTVAAPRSGRAAALAVGVALGLALALAALALLVRTGNAEPVLRRLGGS